MRDNNVKFYIYESKPATFVGVQIVLGTTCISLSSFFAARVLRLLLLIEIRAVAVPRAYDIPASRYTRVKASR